MTRQSRGIPPCPACDSTDTRATPAQAHPYLCMQCGRLYAPSDSWEREN